MRSIKGKELMKLEKWDKRGSRDPDHHEGCMVSRLLGERRNLDRAQIDQKMRSIRGEQTLSAVYNTPIDNLFRLPDKSARWKTIFSI